jgi:hypothetical protein
MNTSVRRLTYFGSALLTLAANTSCVSESAKIKECQQQVEQLTLDLRAANEARLAADAEIQALRRRLENDPRLANVTVEQLFTAQRLELASRTGGIDLDGKPGDDGVVVYAQPRDADGDALKAAGEFTIELLDLTQPGRPRSLGTFRFTDREELRKSWYGGLMTYHYTFKCPFPEDALATVPREVHIRVTFLDWLTGRELTADRTVPIERLRE